METDSPIRAKAEINDVSISELIGTRQLPLPFEEEVNIQLAEQNAAINDIREEDLPIHRWYRFVLSYPPHLIRMCAKKLGLEPDAQVLDPFCGTGTTPVECKKLEMKSVGIEAHPMAYLASKVKTDWSPDPDRLLRHAEEIEGKTLEKFRQGGIRDRSEYTTIEETEKLDLKTVSKKQARLIIKDTISPLPLHKTLLLLEEIENQKTDEFYEHEKLALARALVETIGNLKFGPEVGVGNIKADCAVVNPWKQEIEKVVKDLRQFKGDGYPESRIYNSDARKAGEILEPNSIDAVITSPPYPNEKDYTRIMRLESVLLGFAGDIQEMRKVKKNLVRSNTRCIYKEDRDDEWIREHARVMEIAEEIEKRRKEMGKTSGFEKAYHRVTKQYFGGMKRHLAGLRKALRPGATLAYVVGDQASYLQVMIRTGQILAEIAESLGYEVVDIDLFRTRLATATQEQLREEVLILRWSGGEV